MVAGAHVADVARGHEPVGIVPGSGAGGVWRVAAGGVAAVDEGGRRGGRRAGASSARRVLLRRAETFSKRRMFEARHVRPN